MQCQTLTLDCVEIKLCTELICLGVVFNYELTFAVYIRRLAGKCFYHLRQLRTGRRTPTKDAAKTVVHAIITSRVDYCNNVFNNASGVHLYPLQSVLHAAAREITWKRMYDHISATIRDQLHWLPVKERIDRKLCTFIYKCLHNMAPVYLSDMCISVSSISDRSSLLSATYGDLWHRRIRTKTFDPRVLRCWDIPCNSSRSSTDMRTLFCSKLKSIMFNRAYIA